LLGDLSRTAAAGIKRTQDLGSVYYSVLIGSGPLMFKSATDVGLAERIADTCLYHIAHRLAVLSQTPGFKKFGAARASRSRK
jgi:hypothetical protein